MRLFKLTLFFLSVSFISYSQCTVTGLDLGADTALCEGDSITLNAGSGFLTYLWNTGETDSLLTVDSTGLYICTGQVQDTTNLIVNGDFSLGNTAFTTNYVYGTGGSWGLLSSPGQYAISTNANLTHTNFVNCSDHTTGTGNYMIVNGASTANTNVWCQTVTVQPSTTYVFSSWFTSVVSSSPAILNFSINGVSIGANFTLSSTTCNWQNYYQTWTSGPTQTSAIICILNQNIAGGGNDFGLDDIYFAEVCESVDTVQVDFIPIPTVDLGNDTVICPGNTLSLDVTDSAWFTYLWSDGTIAPLNTISITDSNLWVQVSNGNCVGSDSLRVTVSAFPQVDLGSDQILCPNETLTLSTSWPQASYLWQNSSTNDSLIVTQSGAYWVQVTDQCGVNSDTVIVDYVSFPLVDLGPDTALCVGDTLPLDVTISNGSYLWWNNSVSPNIDIASNGTYTVAVTQDFCTDYDTINVSFNPYPIVNLGNDTILCPNETILLSATNTGAAYLWQDNSLNSTFLVSSSATYWVEVGLNNCVTADTINVNYFPPLNPSLGNDTSLCDGDNLVLSAYVPNATFLWQDNSTDSILTVSNSGVYWVEVTNNCTTITESITVLFNPIPNINLGADTTICFGEVLELNAKTNNGIYLWQDNSTLFNYLVNESGTYSVKVSAIGCTGTDEIIVQVTEEIGVNLGDDKTVCSTEQLILYANIPDATYIWQDSSTSYDFEVNESGIYKLTVIKESCSASDSILVEIIECGVELEMPNIFTPNGDGQNDVFTPMVLSGVFSMETSILNRWGEEIYTTNNPKVDWSGKNKSDQDVVEGVYFWIISVQGLDQNKYTYKGTVTLLK